MAEQERKYTTNAVVNKFGETTIVSVLSAEVMNVANEGGMVKFDRTNEAERTANVGTTPTVNKTKTGKDAASARIVLINDTKAINFGGRNLEVSTDKQGNERIYLDVIAYNGAAKDLARVAKVGGRISILNAELRVNESNGKQYGQLVVGNYKQVGTAKVSKAVEGETDKTVTPEASKAATPVAESSVEEIPASEDPFADFE